MIWLLVKIIVGTIAAAIALNLGYRILVASFAQIRIRELRQCAEPSYLKISERQAALPEKDTARIEDGVLAIDRDFYVILHKTLFRGDLRLIDIGTVVRIIRKTRDGAFDLHIFVSPTLDDDDVEMTTFTFANRTQRDAWFGDIKRTRDAMGEHAARWRRAEAEKAGLPAPEEPQRLWWHDGDENNVRW